MRTFVSLALLVALVCVVTAAAKHDQHKAKKHHQAKSHLKRHHSPCQICEGCNNGCVLSGCGRDSNGPSARDATGDTTIPPTAQPPETTDSSNVPCCQCDCSNVENQDQDGDKTDGTDPEPPQQEDGGEKRKTHHSKKHSSAKRAGEKKHH